jgi:hypothetical protein
VSQAAGYLLDAARSRIMRIKPESRHFCGCSIIRGRFIVRCVNILLSIFYQLLANMVQGREKMKGKELDAWMQATAAC